MAIGSGGYGAAYRQKIRQGTSYLQSNAEWSARRQASIQNYQASQSTITGMFSTASNAVAGSVNLTMQIVTQNMQESLNAKVEERQKRLDSIDISV